MTTIRGAHADHLVPADEIVAHLRAAGHSVGKTRAAVVDGGAVDGDRLHRRRAGGDRPAGARVDGVPHARPARGDRGRPPRPPVARPGGVRARRLGRRPPPRVRGLRPPRRGPAATSSTRCGSGWPGTTTSCSTARTSPSSAAAGSTPRADPSECGRADFPTSDTRMTANTRMAASGGRRGSERDVSCLRPGRSSVRLRPVRRSGKETPCWRCTSRTGSSTAGRRCVAGLVAIAVVAWSLRMTAKTLDEREVPIVGLVAAFVFAVQMLNFPVANGTSGHLLGGVLAAVLVGPYAGALAVTVVLVVQALLFADGGLSALGLNVVNMALVGAFVGYGVFRRRPPPARSVARRRSRRRPASPRSRRRCWPPSRSPSSTPSAATTRCRSAPSPPR